MSQLERSHGHESLFSAEIAQVAVAVCQIDGAFFTVEVSTLTQVHQILHVAPHPFVSFVVAGRYPAIARRAIRVAKATLRDFTSVD